MEEKTTVTVRKREKEDFHYICMGDDGRFFLDWGAYFKRIGKPNPRAENHSFWKVRKKG